LQLCFDLLQAQNHFLSVQAKNPVSSINKKQKEAKYTLQAEASEFKRKKLRACEDLFAFVYKYATTYNENYSHLICVCEPKKLT
jgi:hypothetical protein